MSNIKKAVTILKSQKGQGVWEYVVTIIGAVVLGTAVSAFMRTNLASDTGAAGKVITKVNSTIDNISTP
ncbi:hypothetical protein [Syntrophomonas palmitatica]|uniref:hypothetical protein n=1 Tax=Syntrophomonas palmitatica TaxID=402877 RepID=UPI0006D1113A|nr:hypothetical protein [Syntrophomonas palmitatica]